MITEQVILSIYAIILIEIGLLLLILILMVWDLKNTIDSVRNLINKFIGLGNTTLDAAEELKSKLTSLSTITGLFGSLPVIITSIKNIINNKKDEAQNLNSDDLGDAISKASSNKRKRII